MRIAVNEALYLTEIRPSDKLALVALLNDRAIYENTLTLPHPYTAR